jgi:hypothetical protein
LLTQSDFVKDHVRIHWALSYFKGGVVVTDLLDQQGKGVKAFTL